MTVSRTWLTEEAIYLHRGMFGYVPNSAVVDAYVSAHEAQPGLFESSDAELATVHTVVAKSLSPTAIEVWLRSDGQRHLLSRKLLLLSYIAECDAGHQEYLTDGTGPLRAHLKILSSGALAAYSLLKGKWQIYRHGLV